MEINFNTLPAIVGLATILFAVYFLMYYKFFYSVVDNLLLWVFLTSFASVLAIQIIPDTRDLLHFFGCQFSLWVGFVLAYRRFNTVRKNRIEVIHEYIFSDQETLRWTTYLLLAVYLTSNLIIGYNKGFALLSDTPSSDKIADFQGGFGLFRKINWSTGTFARMGLIYICLLKKRNIDLLLLLLVIFLTSLSGSKAAFVEVVVSIGIILFHPAFSGKKDILKKFQRYLPAAFIASMTIVFVILAKENDGAQEAFFAFVKRLLYSADSVLYYYNPVNIAYFENYSFGDYLSRLVNPTLGFLRLQTYVDTPGNIMVENLRPPGAASIIIVGPNAPFYIEGRIYFNFWVAFPYCTLIGYLYASIRTYYFSLRKVSAFYFIYTASFMYLTGAMIVDMSLAMNMTFDLFFFVVPPYIVVSILLTGRLKLSSTLSRLMLSKTN